MDKKPLCLLSRKQKKEIFYNINELHMPLQNVLVVVCWDGVSLHYSASRIEWNGEADCVRSALVRTLLAYWVLSYEHESYTVRMVRTHLEPISHRKHLRIIQLLTGVRARLAGYSGVSFSRPPYTWLGALNFHSLWRLAWGLRSGLVRTTWFGHQAVLLSSE